MSDNPIYQELLNTVKGPDDKNSLFDPTIVNAVFKRWINNQTRLNETNMNELTGFIQKYAKQIGISVEEFLSRDIESLIELNAGWKVQKDSINLNEDGTLSREVNKGELFNDYINNKAEGKYSSASGTHTSASGENSSANGLGTVANESAQFIVGKYNKPDSTGALFEVGNGTGDSDRNNAFVSFSDGHAEISNLVPPNDNSLTTKKYVNDQDKILDEKIDAEVSRLDGRIDQEIEDRETADEELQRQIDLLTQLNEWLGSTTVSLDIFNNHEELAKTLTEWVKSSEKRDPRNGDQVTVIPQDSSLTSDEIPYPELWMFVENDNDPATKEGSWQFYSSLQELRNASKTIKGLVKIGSNIDVAEGVISVPIATQSQLGVIKVGTNLTVNPDGLLAAVDMNSYWDNWE